MKKRWRGGEKKGTERDRKKERETDRHTGEGDIVILNLRSASQANTKRNGNQQKEKKSFAFNSFNFNIPATERPNSIVAVNSLAVFDKNSNSLKQINAPKCTTKNKLTFKT